MTPLQLPLHSRAERWIIRLGFAALALAWVSVLILGFFSQPGSDDFCKAISARELGVLASIVDTYMTWSGRYTSESLLRILPSVSHLTVNYWIGPVFIYLLLTYAMFFASSRVLTTLSTREALFLSVVLIVLYVMNMPNLYEGLYWNSGSFTYQLGNILLLFLVGLVGVYYHQPKWQRQMLVASLACIVAILAVGTNEITLVIVTLVCLAGSGISIVRRSPQVPFWLVLLAVSTIGGIVSTTAPGNSVRMLRSYPNSHRFLWSLYHAIYDGGLVIIGWLNSLPLWAASVLVVPMLLWAWRSAIGEIRRPIWLAVIPLLWLGVLLASFFPVFYATGEAPANRVLNVTYLFFMIGWFGSLVCIVAGLWPHAIQRTSWQGLGHTSALVVLMIGTLSADNYQDVIADLRRIDKLSSFIRHRYSLIAESKAVGRQVLIVPPVRYWPFTLWEDDLKEDPNYWVNRCQASFFGLESLAVEQKSRP